jgi:hypothetical protein
MTSAARSVLYVYGVVAPTFDLSRAPDGLEDAALGLVRSGSAAALVSELDGDRYAPAAVERGTEDVEWLAPRAVAHDRVLTWASDRGPLVPLPMFSLFSGETAIIDMLQSRSHELLAALDRAARGREYVLRVYRIDAELSAVAAELSPTLAELQRAADAASPGQRYLLQRKLETERKAELRTIGQRIARETLAALSSKALAVKEDAAPARREAGGAGAERALVLDAAFLVAAAAFDDFQRELTSLVAKHERRGFRFDFTGPWPLYHFVQNVGEDARRG